MIDVKTLTRDEWLEERRKGIGGSDVGAVLGYNTYKTAYEVWLDKTGQTLPENSESEAAYWGTTLEELVAQEFMKRTDKKVRRTNKMFQHATYPFLIANVDRMVVGENAILECKTASEYLKDSWNEEEVPASYLLQVQHYLNVLDKEYAYIAVLIGGNKFVWKRIERDQELIDMMTEKLVDFWNNYVLANKEPEVDGSESTKQLLSMKYGADYLDEAIVLEDSLNEKIKQLTNNKAIKKELEKAITKTENELKLKLGKNRATFGLTSLYRVSWKGSKRKNIDLDKLEKEYPEVYKTCTVEKFVKRFSIKESR